MAKDRIESKYVTVAPGVELHILEKGEGKPLVFIPGLTFSGEIFKNQLEYFSSEYRVIAIDPRGQGYSAKTVDGNDYLTHGRDVAGLIDALGLKDIVLIGWSTGNLDTWSYVQQFGKDKLRGVVTIDMSPLPLSPDPKWWTEGTIEELSQVATQVLTSSQGCREFFSEYATGVMIQHKMKPDELEYLLDISGRTPYWICRQLFCDAVFSNYLEIAKDVGATLPSLMFIAEHWQDIAKPFVEAQLPGYDTYVMGGHLMFYEYPEKWNHVLEDFLNVLNTIYCLFQRASTGEDELHIRQLLTNLDECADALLLREAAEVKDVILLLRFFPIHLVDEVVHCHCLSSKQRIAVHLALHELGAANHSVNVLIGTLPLPELCFHHADG